MHTLNLYLQWYAGNNSSCGRKSLLRYYVFCAISELFYCVWCCGWHLSFLVLWVAGTFNSLLPVSRLANDFWLSSFFPGFSVWPGTWQTASYLCKHCTLREPCWLFSISCFFLKNHSFHLPFTPLCYMNSKKDSARKEKISSISCHSKCSQHSCFPVLAIISVSFFSL